MLDPDLAHIKQMGDLMLLCKRSCGRAKVCRCDILAWCVMIQDDRDLVFVEHLRQACLFKNFYRNRCRDIISKHQIQLSLYQIAGLNRC